MSRLVRGELLKLRTTRTALGFTAAVVLLTLAVVLITILAGDPKTIADKRSAMAVGGGISALLLVFGVVGAGAEYRHRTLAPALLVAPGRALARRRDDRLRLAGLDHRHRHDPRRAGLGVPLLAGQPGPDLAAATTCGRGRRARGLLLTAMLGVGVGTLVGSQVPAVIGDMVWIFVLEPLSGLIDHIVKFTVGQTATSLGGRYRRRRAAMGRRVPRHARWTAVFLLAAALVDAAATSPRCASPLSAERDPLGRLVAGAEPVRVGSSACQPQPPPAISTPCARALSPPGGHNPGAMAELITERCV